MKSKVLTALLSLTIALMVWVYVVTVISPNSDKNFRNITVGIQGTKVLEERELIIVSTDTSSVSLHLEGNRIDLNKLSSSNITVDVDVSKIYEAGTYDLKYTTSFGDLPNSAITVLSKTPGSVKVVVEEKITKSIPVHIQYSGEVAKNHRAEKDQAVLDMDQVAISGPKSVIDKIALARIDVNLAGRSESLDDRFAITLCDEKKEPVDAQGVVTNVAEVGLKLRIVAYKEVPLVYTVKDGAGATKDTCTIELPVNKIQISGSEAQLSKITQIDLGIIDLSTILENVEIKRDIKLPDGVNNDSGLKQATIKVSFPDLEKKTIRINSADFVVKKPAVGFELEITNQYIEVEFRGPKASIQALSEASVVVTVDFSGAYEEGEDTRIAVITCNDHTVGQTNPGKQYEIKAVITSINTAD